MGYLIEFEGAAAHVVADVEVGQEHIAEAVLQFHQPRHDGIKSAPVGLLQIIPADGFAVCPAGVTNTQRPVVAGVDGEVVAKFGELPDHLGTGQQQMESGGCLYPAQSCCEITDIIGARCVTEIVVLVHQPFFVVALEVAHPKRLAEVVVMPVVDFGDILLAHVAPTHGGFVEADVEALPRHHALPVIGKFVLLAEITQMLENDIGPWVHIPNLVGNPLDVGHTLGVISAPGTDIASGILVGEPLRQIKAESVNLVLGEPVLQYALEIVAGGGTAEVEIAAEPERMRRSLVEPGIVGGRPVHRCVPVQLGQRRGAPGVVEHDVLYDGDTALVAFINEKLQVCIRAVVFVGRVEKIRIIAPAAVGIKFIEGH